MKAQLSHFTLQVLIRYL